MRIADGVFWMAERNGGKLAIRVAHPGSISASCALPPASASTMPGDVTFRDLARQIVTVGRFFRGLGGRPGDIVALHLDNSPSFLVVFLGLAHAGFIAAPLNTRLTRMETDAIVNDMQPWRVVKEKDGELWVGRRVDVDSADARLNLHAGLSDNAVQAADLDAGLSDNAVQAADLDAGLSDADIFYLGYSSGTTGQPKGLLRTHKSWTESFFGMTLEFGLATDTVLLVPGPLCYSASLIAALHALFIGGTVFIERTFAPHLTATLLSHPASPVNAVFMVPAMYRAVTDTLADDGLANEWPHDQQKPKSLTCVTCGDKMPQDLYERFTRDFPGSRVFEYYGSSEVGFVSVHNFDATLEGSVGQPFFPVQVRVLGGEIQVKSGLGFAAYFGAAEHQHDRVRRPQGWFAPGDHGRIHDGWLHVTGRSSDLIVRGGVNLYPAEIESVVREFPGVIDTVAFGVPHDRLGEVPVCAVVWRDQGDEGSVDEAVRALSEHLRHNLTGYKQPDAILSLPNLPRNAAGKVSRAELRDVYFNATSSRHRHPVHRV
ncbi:class I adenylate-forming enzyme family protein [Alicyclobacillus sp. ALC3]|uniref:class I adenylate-forming enzyme family protein n=1 Tax=Alicyclobacillus sp. ALC3 TaxID=2796143 RepID=UPI0023788301|nr:class I adenylate-forming enzyme family protein [Alicyclobacillus sp. ALC3]WDL95711.1 acyl--CoA ligase [Alicyclobacillus sp. ALC3]